MMIQHLYGCDISIQYLNVEYKRILIQSILLNEKYYYEFKLSNTFDYQQKKMKVKQCSFKQALPSNKIQN